MSRQIPSHRRRGFTLVEMLVVIVIILILIGLLVPAVAGALAKAHETAILSEIQQLDSSLKAFNEKYGSYPPSDFTGLLVNKQLNMNSTVAIFVGKAFPRCNVQTELSAIVALEGGTSGVAFSPAQALVFWLTGFSGDPEHPITGRVPAYFGGQLANTAVSWPFIYSANPPDARFTFDPGRLVVIQPNGTQVPPGQGVPPTSAGTQTVQTVPVFIPSTSHPTPYVYFASQDYAAYWGLGAQGFTPQSMVFPNATALPGSAWVGQGGANYVRPYLQDNSAVPAVVNPPYFVNPNSFQIISAGLDDDWGVGACIYSTGASTGTVTGSSTYVSAFTSLLQAAGGYAAGDKDNLTNFSPGELTAAQIQP